MQLFSLLIGYHHVALAACHTNCSIDLQNSGDSVALWRLICPSTENVCNVQTLQRMVEYLNSD